MSKIFYKKRLIPDEEGLLVWTEKWVSIHETPHFHYCIPDFVHEIGLRPIEGETLLQAAKRRATLKRVAKAGSRFAFDTEEKALERLRFLKGKHVSHMKREMKFIEHFLKCEKLEQYGEQQLVPGSRGLVLEHLRFD